MIKVVARAGSVTEAVADALVVNLFKGEKKPGGATAAVDAALNGLLSRLIVEENFKGESGQTMLVHTHGKLPAKKIILVGLGEKKDFDLNSVRKAAASAAKKAEAVEAKKVASVLHGAGAGRLSATDCAQAVVEGTMLGCYKFNKYKSEDKGPSRIQELAIIERDERKIGPIRIGMTRGEVFAKATNYARDLINEPANVITPTALAGEARKIAAGTGLLCQVFERNDLKRMGMGAFLAVAQGSDEPPAMIKLTYRPKGKAKKKVALVGKGITFDSGGLNIKSAEAMLTMKDDMSGAAAVLAIMGALAKLKPDLEVMGIVGATENMPGGKAYKQGDVLKAYNGKTIEISNTDAEGRLVLADLLAYADKAGVDEIINIATLTGACIVALGNTVSGVMGNDQALIDQLIKWGSWAGEKMWQLPLFDEYKEQLKSEVADLKNSGGREAGASQGGIFLKEFVGNRKWAHLDIAGPSFSEKEREDCPKGGTGVGVRTLLCYLTQD